MDHADDIHDQSSLLRAALGPAADTSRLELLGEGFSSLVIAAGDTIIRIPRHRDAADRQATMMAVLPELRSLLPVPVPAPIATIPAGPGHPFGATVLKRLDGVPMQPGYAGAALVAALGHVLAALHAIGHTTCRARFVAVRTSTAHAEPRWTLLSPSSIPFFSPRIMSVSFSGGRRIPLHVWQRGSRHR